MLCTLVGGIFTLLVLYALVAYIRRKFTHPDYNGKIVWITGASSGIGEYMAYEYNSCGAYVILSARNVTQLQRVLKSCKIPERAQIVKLDMSNYAQIQKVTKKVLQRMQKQGKKLDVLVENAGQSMRCLFHEASFENHITLMNVNVHGPYKHMQLVLPHMINNKSGQIIGITSQAAKLSTAFRSSYAASKAAFIGIMDSLRSELKPYGIGVCNVMPGYIRTNISKNALGAEAGKKFGKVDKNIEAGMEVEQFAREAVAAAYNNEKEVSIGRLWTPVIGIALRNLCPDLAFYLLYKNAKDQEQALTNASDK